MITIITFEVGPGIWRCHCSRFSTGVGNDGSYHNYEVSIHFKNWSLGRWCRRYSITWMFCRRTALVFTAIFIVISIIIIDPYPTHELWGVKGFRYGNNPMYFFSTYASLGFLCLLTLSDEHVFLMYSYEQNIVHLKISIHLCFLLLLFPRGVLFLSVVPDASVRIYFKSMSLRRSLASAHGWRCYHESPRGAGGSTYESTRRRKRSGSTAGKRIKVRCHPFTIS